MAIKYKNNHSGIINVYKEKGYTSHDVVAIIRKLSGSKSGHTGTLDPNAEGVLPICLGKSTKLADYIMASEKEYIAEIILGKTMDTGDMTGNIIKESAVDCNEEEIKNAINSFIGEYYQMPPMYSAIKINGKKLYELAREGKEIEREKRLVNIKNIEILDFISNNKILINVCCSKGTYIRSLCEDIGNKLGCGAHMGELTRTRTGNFLIKNSHKLSDIKNITDILIPPDEFLSHLKKTIISESANKFLYNGNTFNTKYCDRNDFIDGENVLVYDYLNNLIGIYLSFDDSLKPLTMLGELK